MDTNKAIARRFYDEVLNGRNTDLLDELAVPHYEEHDPLPGQGAGLDGLKDRVSLLVTAFDPHFTIEDLVAEDDKVVVRWTNSGTNVGEFAGMPATGRSFSIQGIDIYRVEGDKLAEHWHVIDLFGQMQQLGLLPSPPAE
jgi:steroid delta-isomerase-like uncharacterized protein